MAAPLPASDAERVEELRRYAVLDTPEEAEFDELAQLAAEICGTPAALVTLVDDHRQWFKARHGFALQETPRELSFCAHTILEEEPTVVADALEDERFRDNPLVTGDPGIRFYAGAVMTSPAGHHLGTVCVFDREPRRLHAEQIRALRLLGRQGAALLEVRRQRRELAEALEQAERPEGAVSHAWEAIEALSRRVGHAFWVVDGQRLAYVSPSFDFLWGRPRAAFAGGAASRLAEVVHEADRASLADDAFARAAEYRIRRRDGTIRWIRQQAFALGEGIKIGVVAEDVTAEVAARVALQEVEERFALLVDSVTDHALFALDPEGRVATWNPGAERITGHSEAQVIGRRVRCFFTDEDRAAGAPEEKLRAAERDGSTTSEGWRVRRDGTRFWALETVSAMRTPDGRLRGFSNVTRDLSERRATEQRFASIVEQLEDALWVADPDTLEITFINHAYERIWGRPRRELHERSDAWFSSVHPEDQADFLAGVSAWRETMRFDQEVRIVRPDGGIRRVRARAFPIEDESGRLLWLAGIGEDVTEQHAARTERRELERRVSESQKLEAVGRLTGGIAHDFNNVLAVITGSASLLRDLSTDPDVTLEASEILQASERAATLIEQLLAVSRPPAPAQASVDLAALLHGMEELLRRTLGETIRLELRTGPGLPPARLERSYAEQVVLNLAVNAREAMPGGGRLTVALDGDANGVRLTVADTGGGVPDEVRGRIYEPFFTTKETGTGLGLWTVHRIVTAAGGSIDLLARPGGGSRFVVSLPAAEHSPPPSPKPGRAPVPAGGAGRTVLVVEDEPALRRVVERTLRAAGYEVVAPATPRAALELIRSDAPIDVLLTDVVMPDASGSDLLAALREQRPGVPAVLMSGYADSAHRADLSDVRVLAKPFLPEQLLSALSDAARTGGA